MSAIEASTELIHNPHLHQEQQERCQQAFRAMSARLIKEYNDAAEEEWANCDRKAEAVASSVVDSRVISEGTMRRAAGAGCLNGATVRQRPT